MDIKKQNFIEIIDKEIFSNNELLTSLQDKYNTQFSNAVSFWEVFKTGKSNGEITENGLKILKYMQEKQEQHNNIFSSKDIAEGLHITSRSVSGSMRKLVTDSYVEKLGNNPVCYSLTEQGKLFSCN